jgi:hypothetical protein
VADRGVGRPREAGEPSGLGVGPRTHEAEEPNKCPVTLAGPATGNGLFMPDDAANPTLVGSSGSPGNPKG